MKVGIKQFGKDHWSTFVYIETRCVDHKGIIENDKMRTDIDRHLFKAGNTNFEFSQNIKYPTILKGGIELQDHDDWDCVDDLIITGLLKNKGTKMTPVFEITDLGWEIVKQLRRHRSNGNTWDTFIPEVK